MDLGFFNDNQIFISTQQFFSSVLNINLAPAAKSEINIADFLKEYLTDPLLLAKVKDARLVGMINNLILEGKTEGQDTGLALNQPSDDYDMLLVFGIELNKNIIPTKTDISRLTRALNRRSFNRPVVLILKHGSHISFSSAERGQYKRAGQQGEKIGRISILRDIDTKQVHAGHERILLQLCINPLKVSSFKELYAQWLDVFNLKTLNNDFYKKISDWYFWATTKVKFPTDHYKLKNGKNHTEEELQTEANQIALIRFLTRIIFVWFLKSKSNRIVPEEIFDIVSLRKHLKFNDAFESNYYKAILQNLFFASFNTKIDSEQRTFSSQKRTTFLENRFRYASLFINPDESAKELFANIPFLNGGLFSNLDYKESNKPTVRVDWFSDPEPDKKYRKNELYFPDLLFFDDEHEEDLSDFYESYPKRKVKGLLLILKEYYFTIEENTPLEQEIALDPELLGKIFENLLASYNPETRTTARKQTGSYYTPREIVNYMVDESLVAYIKTKLSGTLKMPDSSYHQLGNQQTNMFGNEGKVGQLDMQINVTSGKWDKKEEELENKLRQLFAYESEDNPFLGDTETTNSIIGYLSECKILDPACGSGAFPMGVLHQIVHALKKLDLDNEQWKNLQYERLIAPEVAKITNDISVVQKLSSEEARKIAEKQLHHELTELRENFKRHDHNYTRKLHLIQECIYGVDIQPIAIHISKLRFFISLLVDQNIDFNQRDKNYLLNSLPNLETKFVAANTLIPLNPGGQLKTRETDIVEIEDKIKAERKKYFVCKSREEKIKIEKADEALRKEFAAKLKKLTEQGRNNLKIQIQKIEEDIELRIKYKAKAQSDKDKTRITKGIEQLRKDLEKLIAQMAQFASGDEVADKILNFNPYDANTSAPFFDPEIMFALQPGTQGGFFDIVIGNPPYVQLQKDGGKLAKEYENKIYTTFERTGDIYSLFYEGGFKLLEKNGVLTLITSNKWMRTNYGKSTRNFFTQKTKTLLLVDFGNIQLFENATVDTNILILQNSSAKTMPFKAYRFNEAFANTTVADVVNSNFQTISFAKDETWVIGEKGRSHIAQKVRQQGITLKDWNISINYGIKTGFNEAFIIDAETKERLIKEDPKSAELLKPILRGKDIQKWMPDFADLWLIATFPSMNIKIDNYPSIKNWLLAFGKEKLVQDGTGRKKTGNDWFETQDQIAYWQNFEQPKIIYPNMTKYLPFIYDEDYHYYHNDKSFHITGKNLKWLVTFFNSSLFKFTYIDEFPELQGGTRELRKVFFDKIPVKQIIPDIEKHFNALVDKLYVELKQDKNSKISTLETRLDLMAYKLYELTYDECKIVDPGIEKLISREDYEKMSIEELAEYNV